MPAAVMSRLYIALLHYPVYNRRKEVVATAVTNLDIHDIARAAMTFGVRRFYIVTPVEEQRDLVRRIADHWGKGFGSRYNPFRKEAFRTLAVVSSLEEAKQDIAGETKMHPVTVATGASLNGPFLRFSEMREKIRSRTAPYLILFGTGWGLAEEVVGTAEHRLEPIRGTSEYNHLSVRSAAAIVLERITAHDGDDGKTTPERNR
jgi:hypothetical protein